jgi:hypothetical protein
VRSKAMSRRRKIARCATISFRSASFRLHQGAAVLTARTASATETSLLLACLESRYKSTSPAIERGRFKWGMVHPHFGTGCQDKCAPAFTVVSMPRTWRMAAQTAAAIVISPLRPLSQVDDLHFWSRWPLVATTAAEAAECLSEPRRSGAPGGASSQRAARLFRSARVWLHSCRAG